MNVEIAQRLAELRRQNGYSQEELAEKLGLSRQAVSKWERAESSPDTNNLISLARLYGTSLDELLAIEPIIEEDIAFETIDRAQTEQATQDAQAPPPHYPPPPPPTPYPQPTGQPYGQSTSGGGQATKARSPLLTFPYPVVVVIIYLVIGFFFNLWHPGWIIFLTIPFYYWIVSIVQRDQRNERNEP